MTNNMEWDKNIGQMALNTMELILIVRRKVTESSDGSMETNMLEKFKIT
jgi:hypothetical protein